MTDLPASLLYSRRMAASPGFRVGAIELLAALAVILGIVLLDGGSDAADAAPGQRTPARQLLLKPADLGGGYRYFSPDWDGQPNPDVHCAPIRPADSTAAIDEWIAAFAPRGCYALFYRYRGHSEETFRLVPPLVGTGAVDTGSPEAAATGLGLAGLLLRVGLDADVGPVRPTPAGPADEAVFFRFDSGLSREISGGGPKTSVLAWRSGGKLGVVLVGGLPTAVANDRRALALAKRQQLRVPG